MDLHNQHILNQEMFHQSDMDDSQVNASFRAQVDEEEKDDIYGYFSGLKSYVKTRWNCVVDIIKAHLKFQGNLCNFIEISHKKAQIKRFHFFVFS